MRFGDKIAILMADAGVNQEQVASAVEKSQSAVSGWLNGSKPHKRTLERIAAFFDIDVDVLIDDEKDLSSVETTEKAKTTYPAEFTEHLKNVRAASARKQLDADAGVHESAATLEQQLLIDISNKLDCLIELIRGHNGKDNDE